ncbi:MAG: hypothetical protein ACR2N2_12485 [Acidimicrobiia bacterium]
MFWALMALLGVPIWLVVGGLVAALLSRRNFQSQPNVFATRVRRIEAGLPAKWSHKLHARWVHDVLLANKGLALVVTDAYAIVSVGPAAAPDPGECKGLGDSPVAMTVQTDEGEAFEIAASRDQAELLALPFDHDPKLPLA